MKILIVNSLDTIGGAAKASYRLHKALIEEGIDSTMLVQLKYGDDFTVIGQSSKISKLFNLIRPVLDQLPLKIFNKKTETIFSPSWFGFNSIIKKINEINPDIVHLNWITGGMIKIENLLKINSKIVWSLHDNWAFTGGCHIKWQCERFKDKCGKCPNLASKKDNDISRWVWKRKYRTFTKMNNLTIVGLSKWGIDSSKQSSLLKTKKHVLIPNPLNTSIYRPFNKPKARELWNLDINKKYILFGAISATKDINKGFSKLSTALEKVKNHSNVELVVFGSSKPKNPPKFKFKTHYVGELHDEISLVSLYSAVDVMVVPSLQEAFGQTASEAMSCGTPVVAFKTSGLIDIIDHKINGYLAIAFDTTDLANGIDWVLYNINYEDLCTKAREKVQKEFDSKVVAKKFIKLYKEILNQN